MVWVIYAPVWYLDIDLSKVSNGATVLYRSGIGMPLVRGGMCRMHDGGGGDYGEGGSLPCKTTYNLIALENVVGSDFLDMNFVCGVGDELYIYFNEE